MLRVCHLLLWPHLLQYAAEEASCISEAFLSAWHAFLLGLQKHIKNMQPEDQAVKVGCAGLGGGWVVGLGGLGLGHAACAWRLAAGCWLLVLGAAARCARIHCHSSCRLASGVWPPTTTALPLLQVLATYLELEYRTATDGMGDPMMSP